MDVQTALKTLQPHRIVIAFCACAAHEGRVGRDFVRKIHALVCDDYGRPRPHSAISIAADDLNRSYSKIISVFEDTKFTFVQHAETVIDFTGTNTVTDYLRVVIHNAIDSIGTFEKAFALVDWEWDPYAQPFFEPDGFVACFLRIVHIAFSSLDFEGTLQVQESLIRYVRGEDGAELDEKSKRIPMFVMKNAIESLNSGRPVANDNHFSRISQLDVDSQDPSSATELAVKNLPSVRRGNLIDMTLPAAQYAMHLESLRRRDPSAASDSLHRYFDLSLSEIVRKIADTDDDLLTEEISSREPYRRDVFYTDEMLFTPDSSVKHAHQYAALSLAIMFFKLGSYRRASEALDDAIRAAQNSHDISCQLRALHWLIHSTRSATRRHQLLHRASCYIALAKEELETASTSCAFRESLMQRLADAFYNDKLVNDRLAGFREETLSLDRIERITRNIGLSGRDYRIDSLVVSAAAYSSHAGIPTAMVLAKMALYVARREHPGIIWSGEVKALQAVACLTSSEVSPLKAIDMLNEALSDSRMPDRYSDISKSTSFPERDQLLRCQSWLKFEHCLAKHELELAAQYLDEVEAFAQCHGCTGSLASDGDLRLDVLHGRCRLELARRNFDEALFFADALKKQAACSSRAPRVAEGLRLSAEAYLQCGASSSALPLALGALTLSRDLGLTSIFVESSLTLTETVLQMYDNTSIESAEEGENILQSVLARALEGMGLQVRGRARRLQAQIALAKASCTENSSALYKVAIRTLTQAIKAYESSDDIVGLRDCTCMLANVYNTVGDIAQRDAEAKRYRKVVCELSRRETPIAHRGVEVPSLSVLVQDV